MYVTYFEYPKCLVPTILGTMDSVKSRRAEYAEQTRAAILDAAATAFADEGFTATSITRIAAAARVTKGAVYHHFPDKQALFEAVLHKYNEAAQQQVFAAFTEHAGGPWEDALAALSATLDVSLDRIAARLIYVEGPVGLGWRRWRESEDHYTRRNVRLLLQTLIDAGIYPDDIPVDAMTQVVTGMITHAGISLAEVSARQRKTVRRELYTAIEQVMFGLRRRKDAP
jgi:AcrR family transcriptional regulator